MSDNILNLRITKDELKAIAIDQESAAPVLLACLECHQRSVEAGEFVDGVDLSGPLPTRAIVAYEREFKCLACGHEVRLFGVYLDRSKLTKEELERVHDILRSVGAQRIPRTSEA